MTLAPPAFERKIVLPSELAAAARALPRPLVFTNGVFDLLHRGHVTYLARARALGASLVLAVNSDASVRSLKGPSRPVQDEKTRAAVISQLRMSDAVIVFGEDTPQALIEALNPDVLFKGRDYEGKPVAGADHVRANGGRVVLIDLVPDTSTTATIARLQESHQCSPSPSGIARQP